MNKFNRLGGAENDNGLRVETAAYMGNLALEKLKRYCFVVQGG